VALEDDLMRLFGSDRLIGMMDRLGLEEGQVIEHPWVTKSIEIAQRRVEQHNFEVRKQLLEYDNVMNKQREIVYGQRRQILEGADLKEEILAIMERSVDAFISIYSGQNQQGLVSFADEARLRFGVEVSSDADFPGLRKDLLTKIKGAYQEKEAQIGPELMRHLERMVFLQIIDGKWKDHLYAMDNLKEGIGLRAYGQRDPLVEYKREAFEMFSQMIASIEEEAAEVLFKLQPVRPERIKTVFSPLSQQLLHPEAETFQRPQEEPLALSGSDTPVAPRPPASKTRTHPKVGRNDPCPCGKSDPKTGNPVKYKKCCYPKYG
jgi:preprotein translocase subunit SecA